MCEELDRENGSVANAAAGELPDWKRTILANCWSWLAALPSTPPPAWLVDGTAAGGEGARHPDLYSFYEALSVLRNEARRNGRRSHELFSSFGEHLGELQETLTVLEQRLESLAQWQEGATAAARRELLLPLAELHERLCRFAAKLAQLSPPSMARPGLRERLHYLFRGQRPPAVEAIPDAIRDGFALILDNCTALLAAAGVRRLETVGTPFDPTVMIAVGTQVTDAVAPDYVWEEVSGGYLDGERPLVLAKVIATKRKET